MSFANQECPCGGRKEADTMLCEECAEEFGVTHGTVHHAVKRVRDAVQTDSHAKWQVKRFLKCLVEVRR